VADGVESVTGFRARLRWPNDVLVDGRKVAGILAEGVVGDDPAVILGIGINVHQTRKDWPPALRDRATSLAMLGAAVERETVLEAVLACLEAGYHRLLTTGFESVREAWRRRGLLGEPVGTGAGEGGTAEDLDPEGGLLVRRPDGRLVTVVAAGSLG
jgi:BirA family biotin operon repressor/biotin-[acetyl-CoA-carboxylase] ligase